MCSPLATVGSYSHYTIRLVKFLETTIQPKRDTFGTEGRHKYFPLRLPAIVCTQLVGSVRLTLQWLYVLTIVKKSSYTNCGFKQRREASTASETGVQRAFLQNDAAICCFSCYLL